MNKKYPQNQEKITKIEITEDTISGRGGLSLFLRYVERTEFYRLVESVLGKVKTSKKGLSLFQFLKQMIGFIIDGTYMSISSFDKYKADAGYAAVLENKPGEMASSHQIKRFFIKLMVNRITNSLYRRILHELFIWRLQIEKPAIIILGVDTMVLNNDDARKREGVEPTYKKKKGFQPLHVSWGPYLIDVLFRTGSSHSNHGNDFPNTIGDIVELIRKRYNGDVPIIVVGDSGFLSDEVFEKFEKELGIFYIITGKIYEDIKDYVSKIEFTRYRRFEHNGIWSYVEFGNRLRILEKVSPGNFYHIGNRGKWSVSFRLCKNRYPAVYQYRTRREDDPTVN